MATIASPACPQCDEELIRERTDLWRCLYCGLPVQIGESGIPQVAKAPNIAEAQVVQGIYDAQPYVSEVVTHDIDAPGQPVAAKPVIEQLAAPPPQRSKRR